MNRILLYLMLALGEVLIILGFFLFLQDIQPTNLFALNLVAATLIFAACYARVFDFSPDQADMRTGYAGLGLRWLAVFTFGTLSAILIVLSITLNLSFALCLWLQVALLFMAGLMLIAAKIASDNASRTLLHMEGEMNTLKELQAQLTMMEIAADRSPIAAQAREGVASLQQEVNFLTVSLTPASKRLESELTAKFQTMTHSLQGAPDAGDFARQVEDCIAILRVRRQQHYK